jgi:hypothetical protein
MPTTERVIDEGPLGEVLVLPGIVYYIAEDALDGAIRLSEAYGAISFDEDGRPFVIQGSFDATVYFEEIDSDSTVVLAEPIASALDTRLIGSEVRFVATRGSEPRVLSRFGSEVEVLGTIGSQPHVEERD